MPDMWTHLIAGGQALSHLPDSRWQGILQQQRRLFDFGCQGTDFFFYHRFWPWWPGARANVIGEAVHHRHCREFHRAVLHWVKQRRRSPEYRPATAYALGLLCHWAVDRRTHPYIHCISGFYEPNDSTTQHLQGNHKRIELAIDTILAAEHWGLTLRWVPANRRFYLGRRLPDFIHQLYAEVIPTLYPEDWAGQAVDCIQEAYSDMMRACRLFYDPLGLKRRLFGLVGRRINAASYFYLPVEQLRADYLNRSQQEWVHPADQREKSRDSLDQLLQQAVGDAVGLWRVSLAWLADELDEPAWLEALGNLSFSTGKDCDLEVPLRHSRPLLSR